MPQKIEYKIKKKTKAISPVIKFIVIPISVIALMLVTIGIYTFSNTNILMRREPKPLEDFANNILPAYSITSFQSLDGITSLSGWFFATKQKPISTVIIVHNQGNNRLIFDVDTTSLYDLFLNNGFNVLSFDLRHSGNSQGTLSTFGYVEWADVLSAISYVRKNSVTKDVLLYGFGSGVSACLLAMNNLPDSIRPNGNIPNTITELGFDKSYIRALILDTPSLSPDDYIMQTCRKSVFLGKILGQYTIPYAVRLSAGSAPAVNLTSLIARTQIPVHLVYQKSLDKIADEKAKAFISERLRLFPNLTTSFEIKAYTAIPAYLYNTKDYSASIIDFLSRFIID